MENTFPMVAKTFKGLEEVLRDELIALGALNVEIGRRMVSFEGDLEMMYKANLCCRTALRILKPIIKFTANDPDELYDQVREFDWEQFLGVDSTFAIDSTVNSSEFTHSKFVTYRVKDGIADHFNDKYGRRPSIRLNGADVMLNVHIFEDRVTISLDSSGEPLSKRGYRTDATKAPLNEVMAAGIIMKTGWRGDTNFVDPMCGSGTFLIEAALIAANINPGIYRDNFAFERWPDFDRDLFERLYNDDSAEKDFDFKIYGGDIDPEAIAISRANIKRARVEDMIELVCKPFQEWDEAPQPGILVSNPPYGERLKPADIEALYKGIGTELKQVFKGYHAWLLGYNDANFANIGLKPSVKYPMLNGSLECELREYVLFDGTYADFRSQGGSVKDDDFDHGEKIKGRHLSDREWRDQTRRFGKGKGAPGRFRDDDADDRPSRSKERKPKFDKGERRFDKGERRFDKGERRFDDERRPDRERRFDGERRFDKDERRSNFGPRGRKGPYRVVDKGPSLPEESEIKITGARMRSRRSFKENLRRKAEARENPKKED